MKQGTFTVFSIDNILNGNIRSFSLTASIEVSPNHEATNVFLMDERKRKRSHSDDDVDDRRQSPDGRSPSPCYVSSSDTSTCDDTDLKAPRKKKARTCFTDSQIDDMERNYRSQRYLTASDRIQLARSLRLSDQQVKTWFQNRRMKEKRDVHASGHHSRYPTSHVTSGMALPASHWTSPIIALSPAYHAAMMTSYGGLSQRPASLSVAHPAMLSSPLGVRPLSATSGTSPQLTGSGFNSV